MDFGHCGKESRSVARLRKSGFLHPVAEWKCKKLFNGRDKDPGLNAEAEVDVCLVAGVGVEVVRGLVVELVAQAKLAAYEQA